jgi:hypothetical protein
MLALAGGAGITHFTNPGFYDPIVPRMPGPSRAWTYASGVAELTCAALMVRATACSRWAGVVRHDPRKARELAGRARRWHPRCKASDELGCA